MICTVCVEYTENAQDNTIITKTVAYTWAPGLDRIDVQMCLHHICSIHEHSHGVLHTTSVYFHLICNGLIAGRPQSKINPTACAPEFYCKNKQSSAEYQWHLIVRVKHFDAMGFCKVYSFP